MGNLAVKGANKLDGFIDRRLDNSIRQRMHREKCEIHATIRLTIKFGAKQIGVPAIVYFRKRTDGKVYFEYDDQVLYRLVSYEWQGSEFATVSNSNTSGQTKYKERGRTGGHRLAMGAGAAIGSVIAPGVGTVVGAAIGAGGPRRTKTRGRAVENVNETSRVEEIEKDTLAQLVIQNITTKEIYRLMIVCNREIDGMFRCLKWPEEEEFMDQMEQADIEAEYEEDSKMFSAQEDLAEADYTQQLFQLKSLYDSGILTQEEFEGKKRQIFQADDIGYGTDYYICENGKIKEEEMNLDVVENTAYYSIGKNVLDVKLEEEAYEESGRYYYSSASNPSPQEITKAEYDEFCGQYSLLTGVNWNQLSLWEYPEEYR